jgi:hypothetical protein
MNKNMNMNKIRNTNTKNFRSPASKVSSGERNSRSSELRPVGNVSRHRIGNFLRAPDRINIHCAFTPLSCWCASLLTSPFLKRFQKFTAMIHLTAHQFSFPDCCNAPWLSTDEILYGCAQNKEILVTKRPEVHGGDGADQTSPWLKTRVGQSKTEKSQTFPVIIWVKMGQSYSMNSIKSSRKISLENLNHIKSRNIFDELNQFNQIKSTMTFERLNQINQIKSNQTDNHLRSIKSNQSIQILNHIRRIQSNQSSR